jgi:hypothetical protein
MKEMKLKQPNKLWNNRFLRLAIFPLAIIVAYGIVYIFIPDKIALAIINSLNTFSALIIPICLVFLLMLLLNYFLRPAQVAKFMGKEAGVRAIIFSAVAGIISVGPIYAWYPLLKDLKEKGAGNALIAIFLGSRAVKPFLLPVMIKYFGWIFVLVLTVFMVLGAIIGGGIVGLLSEEEKHIST